MKGTCLLRLNQAVDHKRGRSLQELEQYAVPLDCTKVQEAFASHAGWCAAVSTMTEHHASRPKGCRYCN